jgi:hypothetical protein
LAFARLILWLMSDKGRIDEIGNNPMVIRMLAKIGA